MDDRTADSVTSTATPPAGAKRRKCIYPIYWTISENWLNATAKQNPTFRTTRPYTRLTTKALRQQRIDEKGYGDDGRRFESTEDLLGRRRYLEQFADSRYFRLPHNGNEMTIPNEFARRIIDLHGDRGRQWLADLPALVEACAQRWSLAVAAPFPGLSYNYAAPALCADGREAVLKLGVPHPELTSEIAALRHYNGARRSTAVGGRRAARHSVIGAAASRRYAGRRWMTMQRPHAPLRR